MPSHVCIKRCWPMAASICLAGTSRRARSSGSRSRPAAMAPDETSSVSWPAPRSATIWRAKSRMRSRSSALPPPVSTRVPTLTTMRCTRRSLAQPHDQDVRGHHLHVHPLTAPRRARSCAGEQRAHDELRCQLQRTKIGEVNLPDLSADSIEHEEQRAAIGTEPRDDFEFERALGLDRPRERLTKEREREVAMGGALSVRKAVVGVAGIRFTKRLGEQRGDTVPHLDSPAERALSITGGCGANAASRLWPKEGRTVGDTIRRARDRSRVGHQRRAAQRQYYQLAVVGQIERAVARIQRRRV